MNGDGLATSNWLEIVQHRIAPRQLRGIALGCGAGSDASRVMQSGEV